MKDGIIIATQKDFNLLRGKDPYKVLEEGFDFITKFKGKVEYIVMNKEYFAEWFKHCKDNERDFRSFKGVEIGVRKGDSVPIVWYHH